MPQTHVVGAVVTETGVTLYVHDGTTMELPATDWRITPIMETTFKQIARKKVAVIDLDDYRVERAIEKKTGGRLRFALRKVIDFFKPDALPKGYTALSETLVATVNGKEVPGVEKLEKQMRWAAQNDTVGFERFMERLAAVIDQRGHTVQELLSFMEKGDLPIADDGSIVAYKRLCRKNDHFVDPHTGRVTQKLGSFVTMHESLVDPDRRYECSQGLHIARRDYLSSFQGDAIFLSKVAPEDVMAVPYSETSKMRVLGYHLILEATGAIYDALSRGLSMTGTPEGAALLGRAIAGDHPGILETVIIGGPKGTNLTVLAGDHRDSVTAYTPSLNTRPPVPVKTVDSIEGETAPGKIDVAKVQKEIAEETRLAALSGDLSAALSADEDKPLEEPETPVEPEPATDTGAPVDPAPAPAESPAEAMPQLTEAQVEAMHLLHEGKLSRREIEKQTGVSRRTIGRLESKGY